MSKAIYIHDAKTHNTSAAKEILPIVFSILSPKDIIDIGCGTGTWLAAAKELGVGDVLGVDGDYVDRSLLHINEELFFTHDLKEELFIGKRFDLVISLEVAEHLPSESADSYIQTLVNHGDTILFSAAIKNQGGQNHINEQNFSYWQEKFGDHGYKFYDLIRPQVWWNKNVDWWYAQNIFVVSKKDLSGIVLQNENFLCGHHPDWFTSKKAFLDNIRTGKCGVVFAFSLLLRFIKYKILKLMNIA